MRIGPNQIDTVEVRGSRPLAPTIGNLSQLFQSFANPVYNVNQGSLRQAITQSSVQGRMNATMRTIVWGTLPLAALLAE